jgi:alpha-L-fucosidase
MGKWMKMNGEVTATAKPPPTQPPFGRATSKPGRVYLEVFNWPADGKLLVPAWGKTVKTAYLLANRTAALKFTQTAAGVTVQVPTAAPDRIATVVVMETTDGVQKASILNSEF